MQSSRLPTAFLAAIGATLLASAPLAAQGTAVSDVRPNSWYWGVYGGQTSFPTTIARTTAPTVGIDWMITRTRFAMNVFAEQSYFSAVSTVTDFPTSAARRVDIKDMRRIGGSAMIFLPTYKYFHPWFGAGYSFNFVREATPQGDTFASPAARDTVTARINTARTQGKLFGELGVMGAYRNWAPFLQYTVMPTQGSGTWFVNGEGFTNIWKAGIRYNFGPAMDEKF